jgi:hypothetical protein
MNKQDEKRVREIAREEALKCIQEDKERSQREAKGLSIDFRDIPQNLHPK